MHILILKNLKPSTLKIIFSKIESIDNYEGFNSKYNRLSNVLKENLFGYKEKDHLSLAIDFAKEMDAISFFNIIGRKDTSYSDYDKENNKALFKYKDIIFEKLKKEKLISLSKIDNTNRFFLAFTQILR